MDKLNKKAKILVVCGGTSTEREISLKTGRSVYNALINRGYDNTIFFELKENNMNDILDIKPDIVYIGLHGKGGEDGTIQGFLEMAKIPYTGPGILSSAVCMNKIFTKRVLENAGLPTAKFQVYHRLECKDLSIISKEIMEYINLPAVFKSPCQGSSIGVIIVKELSKIEETIKEIFKYGDFLLVEQFVNGTEITLPILGNEELIALPIIEITSEREFYDYTAKYTSGLCHHIIPANISKDVERLVIELGIKAYKTLDCKGLSRIDFIVDPIKGPMIIEVNTLPGMTDMSLFPDAARYAGISYGELVEKILNLGFAVNRYM